ncbi:hypothetical protein QN219_10555 [Sinorhizobium sp. 7-81]|uniref:hypothetical protein n=1 Tax=Sinorhizobium sp. 8-89 TaxID=3049089 RepID=UPI0024C2D610|nr:hypothetical protein [Sinorhizobium sp. 8-89]MDK1490499.1 hypothetical protein [Sinorhizobium sp. 8-89]
MIEGLIALAISILVVGLVTGLIVFPIRRAPFIPAPFGQWAEYLVIVVAVLVIILYSLRFLGVAI